MKISNLISEDISFAEYLMLRLIAEIETETESPEVWVPDIVKRVEVTPQAVSKFIHLAIKKGYIERFENASDRRSIGIRITDRGRAVLSKTGEDLTIFYNNVLNEFSEEEKASMHRLMSKLQMVMQKNYLKYKKKYRPKDEAQMIMVVEYMSEYSGMIVAALVLTVVQAACDLALPGYMADIVNIGVIGGNINYIVQTGIKMLLITLLSAASAIAIGYFAARTAAFAARDMRADVFKRVQTFSNPELDKFSPASLITRTTNDITQIQMVIVMMVRMIFYAAILGIGGVIKAVSESRALSGTIVVAVLALVRSSRPLHRGDAQNAQDANAGGSSEPDQPRKPGGDARDPRL